MGRETPGCGVPVGCLGLSDGEACSIRIEHFARTVRGHRVLEFWGAAASPLAYPSRRRLFVPSPAPIACSSVTERASRWFSSASDTRARLRRSTPTATCGRTRMSGRARLWTPSSVLLRTLCGLRRRWDHERAGHRPVAEGLVCRPGSVPGRLAAFRSATIHLGPPLPAASCGPPAHSGGQPSNVRCSTLLRAGFAEPTRSPGPLVVSCTTVSPLPDRPEPVRRSAFCGTFPRVAPGGCCPPPCPVEPGPSSTYDANAVHRGRPTSPSACPV